MKEPKENVDNRIQYVGQIASEGKHSKEKTKVKISSNVRLAEARDWY